ncbi:Uu.00g141980.m01.CDS01 [Anthostomella pinea]|uniref:Uu.00g141980.m01.CDS01 n=1 Tax=Anthostomella pinea TaxID=933095 RepID=A0AAI8VQE1_9PEZI|nr:Uu.00g141980.m01.CDS01 [Anthostomella pinea]
MAPLYKKVLIIGATSGIGEALATKLLDGGTSVIVTGRRQERLDAYVSKHSNSTTSPSPSATVNSIALDITNLSAIPSFAASVTQAHPDLDSVILNAGIQRPFDFSRPATVDLDAFGKELLTNYTAYVHLVTALLPHLQALGKQTQTHLVFVSASLALVPTLVRTPGYNASKAALHSWITNLRQQLRDNGDSVRVVEVFPPAVQTELHDTRHQPDMVNGGEIGMPLPAYIDAMYKGLEKGNDQFAIGHADVWLADGGFEAERQKLFEEGQVAVKGALAKYLK